MNTFYVVIFTLLILSIPFIREGRNNRYKIPTGRIPKVGDPFEEYVYGCGVYFKGRIEKVTKDKVYAKCYYTATWFQRMFNEPPSEILEVVAKKSDLGKIGVCGSWTSDYFL